RAPCCFDALTPPITRGGIVVDQHGVLTAVRLLLGDRQIVEALCERLPRIRPPLRHLLESRILDDLFSVRRSSVPQLGTAHCGRCSQCHSEERASADSLNSHGGSSSHRASGAESSGRCGRNLHRGPSTEFIASLNGIPWVATLHRRRCRKALGAMAKSG